MSTISSQIIRDRGDKFNHVKENYPYGYWPYLLSIAKACHKEGVFKGHFIHESAFRLDPKDWLEYFMDNVRPERAVKLDLKEGLL